MTEKSQCAALSGGRCKYSDEADVVAQKAVTKTFAMLGVDINNPRDLEQFRQDLRFGGRVRKLADHVGLALATAAVLGSCALIYGFVQEGVKSMTHGGPQ